MSVPPTCRDLLRRWRERAAGGAGASQGRVSAVAARERDGAGL